MADVAVQQVSTEAEKGSVSRRLASLALARHEQEGRLRVRQREQLRRALFSAGESLGWESLTAGEADPVEGASKDVARLTRNGTRSLMRDLDNEITAKKREMTQLKAVAKSIQKLAKDGATTYPAEVTYTHTARGSTTGYVTKTETLVLADAAEAEGAAAKIEKKMDAWAKLREEMLKDLKRRQQQLDELKGTVTEFVSSSEGLLVEVFAVLH